MRKIQATLTQHLGAPKSAEQIGLISDEYPVLFYIRILLPEGEEGGKGGAARNQHTTPPDPDTVTIW